MKAIKLFYQERCPFCKRALQYLNELKEEHPEFQPIQIEMIEETRSPEIADRYDYYYVPTFYLDEVKEHEGGINKEQVEAILRKVLSEKSDTAVLFSVS